MPGSSGSASPDRTLVVGPNWVGDAIMAMPAVQARHAATGERPALLVRRPLDELWRLNPSAGPILTYAKRFASMLAAAAEIRRAGIAQAYVLPNSFRSALVPWLAGVRERYGAPGHARAILLNRVVAPAPGPRHQSLDYLDLLAPGLDAPPVRLALPPDAVAEAARRLEGLPRPVIGILPGAARGPAKRWPAARFAEAARALAADGCGIGVMGGAAERTDAAAVASAAGPRGRSFAGETGMAVWAALLAACDAVLCNDSGGMHLAAAVGTPVVAVFGRTDPRATGPMSARAAVIRAAPEGARDIARDDAAAVAALAALGPEPVLEAARGRLREGRG